MIYITSYINNDLLIWYLGKCYCHQQLQDTLSKRGPVATLNLIQETSSSDICYKFYRQYSLGVGLTYVSVLATTVIGMGLRKFLVLLSKHEAHKDTDQEQGYYIYLYIIYNNCIYILIISCNINSFCNIWCYILVLHWLIYNTS